MRISDELGFNCNIGISTNKLLAKMASDLSLKIQYTHYSRTKLRLKCGIFQ